MYLYRIQAVPHGISRGGGDGGCGGGGGDGGGNAGTSCSSKVIQIVTVVAPWKCCRRFVNGDTSAFEARKRDPMSVSERLA